jgi:transposase
MAKAKPPEDDKTAALRARHALNPRPEAVTDPAFRAGAPFFDARDLVQVKYEMLRQVEAEAHPVSQVAPAFGFSRPSFYQAKAGFEAGGLPGLLPQKPGPRRAHKLTAEVMDFLEETLDAEPALAAAELARRLQSRFGLSVHPRSIERGLARRRKKGRPPQPESPGPTER